MIGLSPRTIGARNADPCARALPTNSGIAPEKTKRKVVHSNQYLKPLIAFDDKDFMTLFPF
jgi:hypothetical protein